MNDNQPSKGHVLAAFQRAPPHFTSDKNGYYWCQIVVNGSFLEPSQHYAWFYADDSTSCVPQLYFQMADEAQCANMTYSMPLFPPVMISDPVIITASTPSSASITAIATTIGVLSVLAFSLGTFVLIILLMLIRKRKIKHKQRNGESLCTRL